MDRDESDKIDPELVKVVQFDFKSTEAASFDWKITPSETSFLAEANKVIYKGIYQSRSRKNF